MDTPKQEFYEVIERDEDGFYVGEVPQLHACYPARHVNRTSNARVPAPTAPPSGMTNA